MSKVHQFRAKSQMDALMVDNETKLLVIYFFATWCSPCKQVMPRLPELAARFSQNVVFVKVDVDESDDLAEEYQITAMPTFIFIKNGIKVDDYTGTESVEVACLIENHL